MTSYRSDAHWMWCALGAALRTANELPRLCGASTRPLDGLFGLRQLEFVNSPVQKSRQELKCLAERTALLQHCCVSGDVECRLCSGGSGLD